MLFFALTLFFSIHKKWNLAKSGARNMASSLSNLVNNLAEGTHKVKCKDCDCFFFWIWKFQWQFENINDHLAIKIIQASLTKNQKKDLRT